MTILASLLLVGAGCDRARPEQTRTVVDNRPVSFNGAQEAYERLAASKADYGLDCTSLGEALDEGEIDRMTCKVNAQDGRWDLWLGLWNDAYFAESHYREWCRGLNSRRWLVWREGQNWIAELDTKRREPSRSVVDAIAESLESDAWLDCSATEPFPSG